LEPTFGGIVRMDRFEESESFSGWLEILRFSVIGATDIRKLPGASIE
jgi:hypothetical protein